MTTLSKEDVVRMAISYHIIEGPNYEFLNKNLMSFVTEARADLVAENERLLSALTTQRSYSIRNSQDEQKNHRELTATRTALAAAEARETKLREAIVMFRCDKAVGRASSVRKTKGYAAMQDAVFDQPRDDSALREMIAGVYEECAKELIRLDYFCAVNVIRALAEKAKGE